MMWTMGYTEAGDFNTIQDPFTGRSLRPLMPRPPTDASTSPPPCFTRIHGTDLLALNHHLAMGEHNKRDQLISTQQVVVSSRWNPTPEQLQTLEELYRSGTRTPSAEQIQQITAQLRKYGKIEGKNVFYWFQNHKARERQKRRRQQLESLPDEQAQQQISRTQNGEKRELPPGAAAAAANRTAFEVEQTKKLASPTNSSTAAEKTVCTQGGAAAEAECKAAAAAVVEGGREGWAQFDDDSELSQQRRNATWQMINLSCSSSSITNPHHHFITTSSISSARFTATSHADAATVIPAIMHANNKLPHHDDFISIFPYPQRSEGAQTLQLFPLRSSGNDDQEEDDDGEVGDAAPYQFFEFLPVKN